MKTIFLLLSIAMGTSVFFVSCTPSETPESREIYVVVDVTASAENKNHPLNLNAQRFIHLSGLDKTPKSSVKYSQSLITEVHLNQVFSVELEPANLKNYNKYKRLARVKKFADTVEKAVKNLEKNAKYDRESSNIFIALANIINKVAENDLDNQLVIIQSDMLDNSFLFSAYDKKQMERLEKSPEFLSQILDKHAPITQSLQKMKVVILYQPNAQTDFAFRLLAERYKAYLLNKGTVSVEIVANL